MTKRKLKAAILDEVADATPPAEAGHNVVAFTDERLLSFVQRVERIEEEIKAANNDKKEVYGEAKSEGFDVPVLKQIIQERRMDRTKFAAKQALLDLYRERLAEAEGR